MKKCRIGSWLASAAALSVAAVESVASSCPVVIPTPTEMRFVSSELKVCGVRLDEKVPVPEYARDSLNDLFGECGETMVELSALQGAGEQEYALAISSDGVRVRAGGAAGFIYAASTLRQLARRADSGVILPCGTVRDRPEFAVRGVNWLLFVESRGWSMDAGDGEDALFARATAAMDVMAHLKLNAALVDGFGWNAERYPGYGRLMRRLAAEARKRAIRLGFGGYNAGYGAQYFPWDGKKYRNVGPDGKEYVCMGCDLSAEAGKWGTCLTNQRMISEKIAEMQDFVRSVEPGFLYVHGLDASSKNGCEFSWRQRCPECRRRWPNDDTTAADGMAGAFAEYYGRLYDGIAAVKPDCLVNMVSPNYSSRKENDDEWDFHLRYFKTLAACLKGRPVRFMLREQFLGHKGQHRLEMLREAVGKDAPFSIVVFLSGDGFYNSMPYTADIAYSGLLKGANEVYFGSGTALQEARQAAVAEYLWNPSGTRYPVAYPTTYKEFNHEIDYLAAGVTKPESVFGMDGLLVRSAKVLYGEDAGPLVADAMRPQWVGYNPFAYAVGPLMPLTNRLIPGCYFSVLRVGKDLVWSAKSQELLPKFATYAHVVRTAAECSRRGAWMMRQASEKVRSSIYTPLSARRDALRRMAETAECGAELADLSAEWADVVVAAGAALKNASERPEIERRLDALEAKSRRIKADYERRMKRMCDPYGGDWVCGRDTAEFVLIEIANMRQTLAKGTWAEHPRRPWW